MKKIAFKVIIFILLIHISNNSIGITNLIGKSDTSQLSGQNQNIDFTSVQCKAIAKSTKKRCKNKTTNTSGYCRVHGG